MKNLFYFSFILFSFYVIQAQTTISGTITNVQGQPLSGANISILENLDGTATNDEGSFQLKIPRQLKSVTLEFSFLGYRSTLRRLDLDQKDTVTLAIVMLNSELELEEVTISAGFSKEKDELPYVISTLKKKDVATSGNANLSQSLSRIPGVYNISFGNGNGKPVIRGLTNNNFILLNNGVKQENFQFSASHPFLVDEFSADRIEVIKGPTSLQYGSDAVGGVINVIKERPAQPNTIQGVFTSNYHTNTNGYLNSLGIKGSGERFFWGVRATLKSHEDFSDGNSDDVFNTRFNEENISLNLGTRADFGLFSIQYNYTRPKYGLQTGGSENLFANNRDLLTMGRDIQVWWQELPNHLITSNNKIFLGKNTLDVDLGYQSNLREAFGGGFNPQQQIIVAPKFASMRLNTLTYNLKYSVPLDQNKLIFGFNGANINNEADEEQPNNPLLDSRINDAGFYAIGDFRLSDKLNMTTGLRYDFRNMTSDPVPTATTDRFEVDNNYNSLTGSLGVVYNFTEDQFIKTNVSSGFRSPSIPELTQNGIHSGRFERGDPNLNAQRNYQFDINYHFHKSWITFDIAPFYNNINNYIYLVTTAEDAPIGGGKIFQHVQNDANLYGGEIAIDIHPTKWFAFHSSYSMVRADLIDAPLGIEHPTFVPQDRITNEIKFQYEEIGFLKNTFAAIEFMNFFKQNQTGQNEAVTPAYNLLNLRIGAQINFFGQPADIFINGFNLANETYIDHLSFTKQLGLNMIGRNIVFGINVPFSILTKS